MARKQWLVLIALAAVLGWIGGSLFSNSKAIANPDGQQRWGYLVITKKVVFDRGGSLHVIASPLEKAARYVTKPSEGESGETQAIFDKIGADGWELVAVIGLIGGDQEFIFKRPI